MKTIDLKTALKDPSNLSKIELDAIIEAQLTAVQGLRNIIDPEGSTNKKDPKSSGKRVKSSHKSRSLKMIQNRI